MNKKATAKKGAENKCAWLYASRSRWRAHCPFDPPDDASYGEKKVEPPAGYRMAGGFAVGRARCAPAKTV